MTEATMTDLSDFRRRAAVRSGDGHLALGLAVTSPTAMPTGTVTFWLTDIEGSTPLWESDAEAMAAAVGRHYAILDETVRRHGGVRPVEQGEGDSMVAVFPRASDALRAAVAAQSALLAEPWATTAPLAVRMALHTGEARMREQTFYAGPSIIRCARLRGVAHGGQILVSTTTAALVSDTVDDDIELRSLGVHALKGLRTGEELFQVVHPDLPDRFPPPNPQPVPCTLPTAVTSFVGRLTELLELVELTTSHRCVSIVGPGGCGKTRLAMETAGSLIESFPDGVAWVELAEITDADRVPFTVLTALGVDTRSGDPRERLLGYLADRTMLLVLDNCEHLTDAAAALVGDVLRHCPRTVVLATSREPLRVPGEQAWRVGPLNLPHEIFGPPDAQLAEAAAAESVQLFCERATSGRHTFRLDETNAAVVADICRLLDGVPLALELAAARMAAFPPERILDGLQERFRLLAAGTRGAPSRQATLAGSVQWSHDLLTPSEQMLLRRLAVFVGPFTLDGVEAVAVDDSLDRWAVLDGLAALVEKSLVSFDGEHYVLLVTIREFAAQRLAEAGETERMRDAHLTHHLGVAATAASELMAGPDVSTLLALEHLRTNLLAAIDWGLDRGDPESAATLAGDLALFWQLHGRHAEALSYLRRTVAALSDEPTAPRAKALAAIGMLGIYAMDLPSGYALMETAEALDVATTVNSPRDRSRALAMAGFMAGLSQPMTAFEPLAEAHEAAVEADDVFGQTCAAAYAAIIAAVSCARPDLAEPHLAELSARADATGSPLWSSWLNFTRGVLHWQAGRLAEAARALTLADDLAWTLGEPTMESWCSVWCADALIDAGYLDEAERVIRRSAGWMERASFARLEFIESRFIALALARGDLAEAERQLDVAEAICGEMGFDFMSLQMAILRARWALSVGDVARAEVAVRGSADYAAELDMPWYSVAHVDAAGRVARAQDRLVDAEEAHHRALALCVRFGFAGVATGTLEALASLAVVGRSWAEAARLYGAAEELRRITGLIRPLLDRALVEQDLAVIRDALGAEEFAAATIEGAELDLAAAAEYAARARGERKRPASGWESLTPTEVAVVELAAQGLTNAEIGQRLFMTAGTAKVHLHHVFTKLGVTRRAELAALATERRLAQLS